MSTDSSPSRMFLKKCAASLVIAAISVLPACEASSLDPLVNDGGTNRDAPLTDAHGDSAIESGTAPDVTLDTVAKDTTGDAFPVADGDASPSSDSFAGDGGIGSEPALDVTSDALAKDTSADTSPVFDGDATQSDVNDAADSTLAEDGDAADVSRDATDSDGGCQCLDADSGWEIATTSLGCFLNGAAFAAYDYALYTADPCIGLHGARGGGRSEQSYRDRNLIGVKTSALDSPMYEYFYDATTKALVGATRTSWWTGEDPLNCSWGGTGHQVTVRAGILPDCDGGTCPATDSRTLCSPPDSGIVD